MARFSGWERCEAAWVDGILVAIHLLGKDAPDDLYLIVIRFVQYDRDRQGLKPRDRRWFAAAYGWSKRRTRRLLSSGDWRDSHKERPGLRPGRRPGPISIEPTQSSDERPGRRPGQRPQAYEAQDTVHRSTPPLPSQGRELNGHLVRWLATLIRQQPEDTWDLLASAHPDVVRNIVTAMGATGWMGTKRRRDIELALPSAVELAGHGE